MGRTGPLSVIGIALLALVGTGPLRAQETADQRRLSGQWALCGTPLTPPALGDPARRDAPDTPVRVEAGQARYDSATGTYTFLDRPVLSRADQRLQADRIEYAEREERVAVEGDVRYQEQGVVLEGQRGYYDLDDYRGRFSPVSYRVELGHLHGDAEEVEVESRTRTHYRGVRLTTCNPGDVDWWLNAGSVTIDTEARQGYAYNAWLSFWRVPIFYTPFISFPVGSDRKTGFLAPSIGNDNDGGSSLTLPWYWNIAPNYDATITPTLYSERGLMLDTELRYLLPALAGTVNASYLPDDDAYGDDRWAIRQQHRMAVGRGFRGELIQHRVSDTDYLGDFSGRLADTSERNLESRLSASYSRPDWTLGAEAQTWQTVDDELAPQSRPYAAQPRLRFRYDPIRPFGPLQPSLQAEAVDFDHPFPELRDTGSRVDMVARVEAPFRRPGYFAVPAVAWEQTRYRLDRQDDTLPEDPDRGLPIYSFDSGIVLERGFRLGGRSLLQTLEPRLFYLYVPEREQDDLPRFDTLESSFSFSSLYRENRFTGPDRIGDANQLSTGLTTRFLDERTGEEYLRLSAGRIFHFDDREVTLTGTEPETQPRSDLVSELRLSLPAGIRLSADYRWDPDEGDNDSLRTRFQWRPAPDTVLNLGYIQTEREGLRTREQAEASFALPLGRQWHLVGGWSHDLLDDQVDERFAGLQFESCCYAVRAVHRSYLRDDGDPEASLNRQFLLELELKGLGGVGDRILEYLDDAVSGYRPARY